MFFFSNVLLFQNVSYNVGKWSEAPRYDCPVEILFGIELRSICDGMRVFVLVSVPFFIGRSLFWLYTHDSIGILFWCDFSWKRGHFGDSKTIYKKYWNICSNILFLLECNFASMYKLDVLFRVAKNRGYIYVINYLDLWTWNDKPKLNAKPLHMFKQKIWSLFIGDRFRQCDERSGWMCVPIIVFWTSNNGN